MPRTHNRITDVNQNEQTDSQLRICLLGKFALFCEQEALECCSNQKVNELFCYLLLYRERAHQREALANLLWEDSSSVRSRRYLSKALWQLQSHFDAQHWPIDQILSIDSEVIQVYPNGNFWLDIAAFERAYLLTQGKRGEDFTHYEANLVGEVVDLYDGDLLEAWYHDWVLFEREHFRQMYLVMLEKLVAYYLREGAYERGILHAMNILRLEPASERTYRRLMQLHYRLEDRTTALRMYDRCVEVLDKELGVEPSSRTKTLYKLIQSDRLDGDFDRLDHHIERLGELMPSAEAISLLKNLQKKLETAQQDIDQTIQELEQYLNGGSEKEL